MCSQDLRSDDTGLAPLAIEQWCIRLPTAEQSLDPRFPSCEEMLSHAEQALADKFVPQRRRDFVLTRGTVRQILATYTNSDAAKLRFKLGANGKPELADFRICFNLAHTRGLAVLIVARDQQIGVDIEHLRPVSRAAAIAKRFFSAPDAKLIHGDSINEISKKFLTQWTLR